MNLSFVQLAGFRSAWPKLGLTDEDLRSLEAAISAAPSSPPVIAGTGGLRKMRFSGSDLARGKSGGVRVCYVYFAKYGLVYLCAVFPKNAKANLTPAERNAFRQVVQAFEQYLVRWFEKGWTP